MSEQRRAIELEIEVPGTPEEVWRAIATGPGISSWYVPHVVEEREGGAASASFGEGPEMQIPGRVAAWEPPHRIVFDGGEAAGGLAFEWLVEARDGGTCVVRLVNSGFGSGAEWDDEYDGMTEGWKMFLLNLRLHLEHFPGRTAVPMLPTATWATSLDTGWTTLARAFGLGERPTVGERVVAPSGDAPPFAGRIVDVGRRRVAVLLDTPAEGTAFLAVEGGATCSVSVWSYLYGPEGRAIAERDRSRWQTWIERQAPV
jgi:uncharacterized protein YndB with AHSA1/START domain